MSAGKGDKPRNCFSKQFRNNYDNIDWSNWKKNTGNPKIARCRWCQKDKPIKQMAIFSFKSFCNGFTGTCKKCIESDEAEAAYLNRK